MKRLVIVVLALGLAMPAVSYAAKGKKSWGVGIQTTQAGLLPGGGVAAPSVWINMGPRAAIQGYFAVTGSSPFVFGMGANYKRLWHGTWKSGLHYGGGLGIGTTAAGTSTNFTLNLTGVVGIHFKLSNPSNIMFNFDAGPAMRILSGSNNFSISGYSGFAGLSIHYLF
jgi:hypothetical protein